MRTAPSFVISLFLTACTTDPLMDETTFAHQLTLPARYASSHDVLVYADLENALATEKTELSYGLADDYPRQVTVGVQQAFVLSKDCKLQPGAVVWRQLADVKGTAAQLNLAADRLSIELRQEGTVSAVLEGEITEQHCTPPSGPVVTSVPLRHQLLLHVHRVAGFVVDQFHQQLFDCREQVVLPTDALLWAPAAHPLNSAGQRFTPTNAPAPASIILRSNGILKSGDDIGRLSAGAGAVSVSVDTQLPVQGLKSFAVVGREALTSVQAALYLRRAAAKGSVSERIAEGMSYPLFFPKQRNAIDIQIDSAMTDRGKLCANLPRTWFTATSSTPTQCTAGAGGTEDQPENPISVATIAASGECRLEAAISGTRLSWSTRFSTTQ